MLFIISLKIAKIDLKFKQKALKIYVRDFTIAQLAGQYRLFGMPFHIKQTVPPLMKTPLLKTADEN